MCHMFESILVTLFVGIQPVQQIYETVGTCNFFHPPWPPVRKLKPLDASRAAGLRDSRECSSNDSAGTQVLKASPLQNVSFFNYLEG